jgi:rhodanese-related sulfurtransferase
VQDEETIGVDELLREARRHLQRVTPATAWERLAEGAIVMDIRSDEQRARDGVIFGAEFVPRNVLEWRLDPTSPHRSERLARRDRCVIVICDEGFQSSLAAANLRRMGLDATDVIGGFRRWVADGLPVSRGTGG